MNRQDAFNQLSAYLRVLKDQQPDQYAHVTVQHISNFLNGYDHASTKSVKVLYTDFEEYLQWVS